jgi:hypothetical protein
MRVKKEGLKNIEIKYKFRANVYGYNKDKKVCELDHFRSALLHDKLLIVNKNKLIFGSYNWSASAEKRNFEDVMIFDGKTDFGDEVITRFLHEFEYLWTKVYNDDNRFKNITTYVATAAYAKAKEKLIIETLGDYGASKLRYLLDRFGPMTLLELKKKSRLKRKGQFGRSMAKLIKASLITLKKVNGVSKFQLSD